MGCLGCALVEVAFFGEVGGESAGGGEFGLGFVVASGEFEEVSAYGVGSVVLSHAAVVRERVEQGEPVVRSVEHPHGDSVAEGDHGVGGDGGE